MKLYHGTNAEFGAIDLNKCPRNRDFGRGFYLTKNFKHAQERAIDKVNKEGGKVVVLEYDFDLDRVVTVKPTLKVKRFVEVCEEWALFVMTNRLSEENDPQHDYDIVEGPVADDRMFKQFSRFLSKEFGADELVKRLQYHKATHQVAFCTESSISIFVECIPKQESVLEVLVNKVTNTLMAKLNLKLPEAMKTIYNSAIFEQLADFSTLAYRKPCEEVYEMIKKELT
ncbi:MAG: DUF3990 domain-containing protein [Planctomycetaceae bacterium]|nr:DUF3990 domain-containing protein [Planctomycetaceae bacterium]